MSSILEVIVFTSGGVLLSLEIIASRVLAPYFGNSIYVWGSLIGVFLTALSVGYAVGGRLADRFPSPAVFSGVVFLAGVLTVPIPVMAPAVLDAIARADFGPQLNPLVGATVLFVVPSVVMGMVSPFAVRLRARAVATMGQTAGSLYAISTVGSIAGTLATSFVLINYLGVRAIILLMGVVLMAMAVLGWLAGRRMLPAGAGVVVAVLLAGGVARPGDLSPTVVYARDTVYHRITVSDEGSVRYLKLDNYWQSATDRQQPRRTVFAYADYMHLPLIFVPEPRRAFLIGLGGGTVPARYVADYPSVVMTVAELDPEVVRTARDFFGVAAGERLRIAARDGRLHLLQIADLQEVILTDAYLIDTIPFHLATREFFALARARLAPGGVVASNIIGALEGPASRLFRAIYKTVRQVFPTVYVFPVDFAQYGAPASLRNIILVAGDAPRLPTAEIQRRAHALAAGGRVTVERFVDAAASLYEVPIRTDDVPVLSDDFAPVDALIPTR
ncbi:MAG: fused MFS/spermidine synthase [Armatimonadota bacterium]|nr:fused MFS/spermidine synthase [Armatimonadota bacterium]MDR7487110.1 fused MFS/spermidine synthase [Armatimonadota bacterium]MDR7531989.1 fused MFS/spermidine synthase [Armatimonadota bacterium]MDR7536849.1 fused MFS/spermidine synthase [Armatimonadota bacterium]